MSKPTPPPITVEEFRERLMKTFDGLFGRSTCKYCNGPMWWCKTKNGKNACISEWGVNHWADCPKAPEKT